MSDRFMIGAPGILYTQRDALVEVAGLMQDAEKKGTGYEKAFAKFVQHKALIYDNIGAQDWWSQHQIPAPPADPLAAFRARQQVSDNCAWMFNDDIENGHLLAALGDKYHQYRNFYTHIYPLLELHAVSVGVVSSTGWAYVGEDQNWHADENRAADALIAKYAAAAGTVPPPSVHV